MWLFAFSSHAVFQSVKEVLQSLVDDGMVSSDKCGVQTVFWCLPSEAVQKVSWSSSRFFQRWAGLSLRFSVACGHECCYSISPALSIVTCPSDVSWPPCSRCSCCFARECLCSCVLVYVGVASRVMCLPGLQKRARIAVLEDEVKSNEAALKRLESQLSSMKAARTGRDLEGGNGRDAFLEQLAADEQAVAALKVQVAEQAASDPERLRELATATTTAREAANRWTDNVDTLRRYVSDKFGMDSADFARQFGVPADMEYLEETTAPNAAQADAPG